MLKALGDDRADMIVGQEIVNGFALAAVADQVGVLQDAQLMGDRRLGHPQQFRDRTHAHLRFKQGVEDLDPGGVGENLEQVAQIAEQLVGGQLRPDPEQKLFMQTVATDYEGILADARKICSLRENMYVKIPVTHDGMRAIKQAKREGLGVLATAIYSPDQAFFAAMNGADYLAPYVNRMCNYGDGVQWVRELQTMLELNQLPSKICAASFKNGNQVHELMLAGIGAVTVAPDVVRAMLDHPGTKVAVEEFTSAWEAAFGRRTFA